MMTLNEVMQELEELGSEQIKNIFMRHGAVEPLFGVKVEDLKKIQKKIKQNHELAKELFATGHYDAMYLAGLIADDDRMTPKDLDNWVKKCTSPAIAEYTVAWVAAESPHGLDMARKWIKSKDETIASAGWNTLSGVIALRPDSDLDLDELKTYLDLVIKDIHTAKNRVRYCMNNFVICLGTYVAPLLKAARAAAARIGNVSVDVGETQCKVPIALDYIAKIEARGSIGKKRKTVKC